MHSILRGAIAGTALALCASFASAAVLNFDDIVGANGFDAMPANYGGLDWSAGGSGDYFDKVAHRRAPTVV